MVRTTRNSNGVGPSQPPPPILKHLDPTGIFKMFLQRLDRIGNQHNMPFYPPRPPPPRQTKDKLLGHFGALRPIEFDGISES